MTLRAAVGQRARELREAGGQRQEDVASAARELGLTWSRSKVAAFERGDKALSAEELLLLPAMLSLALERSVGLSELLNIDQEVQLSSDASVRPHELPKALTSEVSEAVRLSFPPVSAETHDLVQRQHTRQQRWEKLGLHLGLQRARQLERGSSEAEALAARKLGEDRLTVLALSDSLWQRSLTQERDRRLDVDANAPSATVQAKRGRVTRQLTAELAADIERREQRGKHR